MSGWGDPVVDSTLGGITMARPPVRLDEMVSVLPSALGTATQKVSTYFTATISELLEMTE